MCDSSAADRGPLAHVDPEIQALIQRETERKEYSLELIPSENCVSEAVLQAIGSILTDKYCEGYPGRRYYGGCQYYDEIERLAQERARQLFAVEEANVQPHSGSNANMAVYFAFLQPGDTVLGPRLDHGGHLTHGSPVNFSGRFFKVVSYGVNAETHLFEEEEVLRLAREHRPKLIICGATAYARQIRWSMFRRAADEVGALVMADVAHYSGLIVGDAYESPVPYVDVVTSTTHKTLRGPRGGIILGSAKTMKAVNKTVFPGIQGGPLMNHIAAKAVAFREALGDDFKVYAKNVVANARALAVELQRHGFRLLSGGTDSHMLIIDLRGSGRSGAEVEAALGKVGITVNKNTVPNDPNPPAVTSGVRLGTPTMTTRGFGAAEMKQVAQFIADAVEAREDERQLAVVRARVTELCRQFPLFPRWRLQPA